MESQTQEKSLLQSEQPSQPNDGFNSDIQELEKSIIRERYSCQIFPYLKGPMERLTKSITTQEAAINSKEVQSEEVFYLNIYRMELERIKFLVKSYLRARLAKFHKYLILIVNKDYANMLSPEEFAYVSKLYKIKAAYFDDVFLKWIPDDYGFNMFRKDIKPDMIVHPNEDEWAAVRSLKLITELAVLGESVKIQVGEKILIPYKYIKPEINDGSMELI